MTSANALDYWQDGLPLIGGATGEIGYWQDGLPIVFVEALHIGTMSVSISVPTMAAVGIAFTPAPPAGNTTSAVWRPYERQRRPRDSSADSDTRTKTETRSKRSEPARAEAPNAQPPVVRDALTQAADESREELLGFVAGQFAQSPAPAAAEERVPARLIPVSDLIPYLDDTMAKRREALRLEALRIALDDAEVIALIRHIEETEGAVV